MLDALKKLIGADEESKRRRQQVIEEEERERQERIQQHAEKLKQTAEVAKGSDD